jgi:hypothetical protein
MLVTLTAVNSTDKTSKAGKTYTSVGIMTAEHGDGKWINGFGNKVTKSWNKGDKVDLVIKEDPKWGLQFEVPRMEDILEKRIETLEQKITYLGKCMKEAGILGDTQPLPPIEGAQKIPTEGDGIPF